MLLDKKHHHRWKNLVDTLQTVQLEHTVDGRNPAPVDMWFIPLFLGFQPSTVVQDFFHPQYQHLINIFG
jgi:hypothetical protein